MVSQTLTLALQRLGTRDVHAGICGPRGTGISRSEMADIRMGPRIVSQLKLARTSDVFARFYVED